MSGRSILHVIAPAPFGGAESVVRALAAGARAGGADASVAAILPEPGEDPFVTGLRAAGVPVHEIRCGRRGYLAEARALTQLMRRTRPSVVHTHVYRADVAGYRAARGAGVPVVATVHGFTGGDLKNRCYEWLDVRLLRRFDAVLCVAEDVRTRVVRAGVRPSRVHLVPNGLAPVTTLPRHEARRALGVSGDGPVVGWVGRLSVEKGPDLLLDALARLAIPGLRAVLVGDGPEREALVARAESQPEVHLAGARPDAAMLLSAFDVLVLSSRTEGLPMVLLEAMAAGVPVASFAVGGIPDVVSPASAFLAPPLDTAALAAAVRDALEHPDLAATRSAEAGRVLAARFGVVQWLARIESVYVAAGA